jgi:hypothetical protein
MTFFSGLPLEFATYFRRFCCPNVHRYHDRDTAVSGVFFFLGMMGSDREVYSWLVLDSNSDI